MCERLMIGLIGLSEVGIPQHPGDEECDDGKRQHDFVKQEMFHFALLKVFLKDRQTFNAVQ